MEIKTGAQEFFPSEGKDEDYIVFRKQDAPFVYEREPPQYDPSKRDERRKTVDRFCYREGLTKQQYFDWHFADRWPLNFAPLVNKQFLAQMKIDIFKADHDAVYGIMAKTFSGVYSMPFRGKFVKWLYRFYVYMSYIQNGRLDLTDEQRERALSLYKQDYSDEGPLRELYQFFNSSQKKIDYAFMRLAQQQEEAQQAK